MVLKLFIFALISFFVDAATLYLTGYHATNTLLCIYLYAITYATSWQLLIGTAFLLFLQDLLMFGQAGIQLVYLIPLTGISMALSRAVYPNMFQLIALTIIASLAQTVLIEATFLGHTISPCYTVQTIYGNLMGVLLISLIVRLSGLLGNRMRA